MLKITEYNEAHDVLRVRLDGTVNTDSYAELASVLARHNGTGFKTIILDMAGVDFMTDESARNLHKLRGERLRIINCSPFIVMLLETVESRDTERQQ